jgi:NAD(P)-dependent dehydrogenase (short-subunit alcohol dehydrogenase family)
MTEMTSACGIAPEEARSGLAYALSKSFIRWYSTSQAERFNGRGLRIVSVSPGSVDTEMGRLEERRRSDRLDEGTGQKVCRKRLIPKDCRRVGHAHRKRSVIVPE